MSLPDRRKSAVLFKNTSGSNSGSAGKTNNVMNADLASKRSTITRLAQEHKEKNSTKEEQHFSSRGESAIINGEELALVHMCVVTLDNRVCSCAIALTGNGIRIQAADCRSYQSYCAYMSYACVASLMVDYIQVHQLTSLQGHQRQFWHEYAHTLRMIGSKCEVFPSPVTTCYLLSTSSTNQHAMLIYEANTVHSGIVFRVEFHSELKTNVLEIVLKQQNMDHNDYLGQTKAKPNISYRIDSVYLKKYFMNHCIEGVVPTSDTDTTTNNNNNNNNNNNASSNGNSNTGSSTDKIKIINPKLFFDVSMH